MFLIASLHKISKNIIELHKIYKNITELFKISENTVELHKISKDIVEPHKISKNITELQKISKNIAEIHKISKNITELHKILKTIELHKLPTQNKHEVILHITFQHEKNFNIAPNIGHVLLAVFNILMLAMFFLCFKFYAFLMSNFIK